MGGDQRAGLGPTRRRRRLSDAETERRMLDTAKQMVEESGLTVSLEHIGLEDVIRDAGVSRSAVYRRWPYKDLFFSDLLKELARGSDPAISGSNREALAAVHRIILDRLDWLRVPERRVALIAEVARQGALREVETFHESPQWRTYLALHATFLSLPEGDLRDEVRSALAASESGVSARLAETYRRMAGLLGLRMRPESGASFTTLAGLANALVRGLVIMVPSTPEIITAGATANPFGAAEEAEWSQPGLGLGSLFSALIEPDPEVDFDDARIEEVRRALLAEERA